MKIAFQVAVVTLSAASAAQAQQAVQWRVSDGGNGHWYYGFATRVPWSIASERATSVGGYLATCTSAAENQLVRTLRDTQCAHGGAWIGLRSLSPPWEPAANWAWVTGEPLEWSNWLAGEPNGFDSEGRVARVVDLCCFSDSWGDANGDASLPYVVEWSADCNNDGIVDYGQCRDGTLPDFNGNNIPDCCESGTTCVVGRYPVQWRPADGGNGHWYAVSSEIASWPEARRRCEEAGATIACTETADEADFLRNAGLTNEPFVFVGLYQDLSAPDYAEPAGGWRWISGEPLDPKLWQPGEPNNYFGDERYGELEGPGRPEYLNDVIPWGTILYYLEWSADCNADGIVDYGQILDGTFPDGNGNGVPDCCEGGSSCCAGDILADRVINGADLGALLFYWGAVTSAPLSQACDLDRSGAVDGADLGALLASWGACP